MDRALIFWNLAQQFHANTSREMLFALNVVCKFSSVYVQMPCSDVTRFACRNYALGARSLVHSARYAFNVQSLSAQVLLVLRCEDALKPFRHH